MKEPRVWGYSSERERRKIKLQWYLERQPGEVGGRPSLGMATGSFVLVLAALISSQDRFDQPSVSVCLCPQTKILTCYKMFYKIVPGFLGVSHFSIHPSVLPPPPFCKNG